MEDLERYLEFHQADENRICIQEQKYGDVIRAAIFGSQQRNHFNQNLKGCIVGAFKSLREDLNSRKVQFSVHKEFWFLGEWSSWDGKPVFMQLTSLFSQGNNGYLSCFSSIHPLSHDEVSGLKICKSVFFRIVGQRCFEASLSIFCKASLTSS